MSRRYNGPEHESLRAVLRCLMVNFADGFDRFARAVRYMGVDNHDELSPFGANHVRKQLEKQLPLREDFAS